MKVLIKNAVLHSDKSPFSTDILIDNGIISRVGNNIDAGADKIIQKENLHISAGWMDCFANFCDPGDEQKENLESGAKAAAAGGFTEVLLLPNTHPAVDSKSQVEYIIQRSKALDVTIHPVGSVTKDAAGKELAEMYDMFRSGAVAFSDGSDPVQSSGILLKALEYVKPINCTIIQLPDDKNISPKGLMNEGIPSTQLGLAGRPSISEEILVARDIDLLKYTGSKLHFTGISTRRSLELISKAKDEGLNVTCSVTPYHLFFCDEDLREYDTNLKVNPPLRTRDDMFALREGIENGKIDFIASHHLPQHQDDKMCEFEYAKNGMEGLESVFGASGVCGIGVGDYVKMQTINIRKIFGLPFPVVKEGNKANLTMFDPDSEYIFKEGHIFSGSKNNAFIGKELKGKTIGIINGDKLFLNEQD